MLRTPVAVAMALAFSRLGAAEDSAVANLYNPNMARAFASLSTLSYCANEFPRGVPSGLGRAVERNCGNDTGSWCSRAGFAVRPGAVTFLNEPDLYATDEVFAIVAGWDRLPWANHLSVPEERGCLVTFRGSIGDVETGPNWIRNGQSTPVPATEWPECKNCGVHEGYYTMWNNVEAKLLKKLKKVGCTAEAHSAIYVSGHSLGGGMAYLGMYGLKRLGFDVQISYTFASPSVGNSYFTNAFVSIFNRDVPLFRIAHADDRTTKDPADLIHTPFEVYYPGNDESTYTVCDKPAVANCGINRYKGDTLAPAGDTPPMSSPHCQNPLAPYKNFCQFMGLPAINLFYLGPVGMMDFNAVCVNGDLMSTKPLTKSQPTNLLV